MLRSLLPVKQMSAMVRTMIADAWEIRLKPAYMSEVTLAVKIKGIDEQIECLLGRNVACIGPGI